MWYHLTENAKWLCMDFLVPNIQTSLLKITHIHHYRKRHMQERKSYNHICLYSCLCARQVVPAACVSSPWRLGCPVHGSRKQLTANQSSSNEVMRFCLTENDHNCKCEFIQKPFSFFFLNYIFPRIFLILHTCLSLSFSSSLSSTSIFLFFFIFI